MKDLAEISGHRAIQNCAILALCDSELGREWMSAKNLVDSRLAEGGAQGSIVVLERLPAVEGVAPALCPER
jgi:hypothetical protein